jgi:HSP20 family molecular chaperone IbpA
MKLAEGIDGSKISASFNNGLLEVTVRAGAHHQEPERIEIG